MKTNLLGAVSAFLLALVSGAVSAALVPKLSGQVVYDPDRDITWMADANLAASNTFGVAGVNANGTMDEGILTANEWIAAMNAANYLGFSNWRLPTTLQPDPSCERQDEFGSRGFNCTGSEMGHLFYTEFGATARTSVLDTGSPAELAKFTNIQAKPRPGPDKYLSSTLFPSESAIYIFEFGSGVQDLAPANDDFFVWAVRDGDVESAGYIWRVNYTPPESSSLMNGKVETHVLATDPSFGSRGADYWNEVLPVPATQTLMETSVAGGGAPSITFVGQATDTGSTSAPMSGEPIDDDLDKWAALFSENENVVDWELRDLDPRAFYNLVFYDPDSLTGSTTLTTEVDSDGDGVLDQTDTIVQDIGDDFSLFQGIQPDAAGVIRGRWTGSSPSFVRVAGFQIAESVPIPVSVAIDIKPGSEKNPINLRSRGKVPVAVLTTEDFDANTVDVITVQFGPGGAQPVHHALEDVDGDNDWDLILHFNIQETGIACGDTEATLTGQNFDGVPIAGTDSIKTVGCNK